MPVDGTRKVVISFEITTDLAVQDIKWAVKEAFGPLGSKLQNIGVNVVLPSAKVGTKKRRCDKI